MKIYILEAEHKEVPGCILRAFSRDEFRKEAITQLRKEFGRELERIEEIDVELEENFRP